MEQLHSNDCSTFDNENGAVSFFCLICGMEVEPF
jgi:hypothetical protein